MKITLADNLTGILSSMNRLAAGAGVKVVMDKFSSLAEHSGPVVVFQNEQGQIVVGVLNWVDIGPDDLITKNPLPLARIWELAELIEAGRPRFELGLTDSENSNPAQDTD